MFIRLLLLSLVFTTPSFCARGKIRDFVYTSSKKDFSFAIPKIPFKLKCKETRNDDQIVVIIQSNGGRTICFEQILLPESVQPIFKKSDAKALSNFFGRAVMANHSSVFPDSIVLIEETKSLFNQPAHVALIDKPSSFINLETKEKVGRSVDAICVFCKDHTLFVIQLATQNCYYSYSDEIISNILNSYWEDVQFIAESFQSS